ncbi:shikimate dehydrogenase [Rhodococcus fascians]|nr:shikimate dehydrogenase [Rhodococcus fascians]MBY4140979.1 shikimate dehydrogenase [Rhodococcus fascians]MBY4219643.1 shikimate dehydrogenase [Rhodococcus fascians]MBY4221952.1 shikimate dehydrogenase [Rhodococcus fascians]MBY4233953.1 shikimate dehydrogenase [Rhodococcus fascians]
MTPAMHEREGRRQGLTYSYRIIDTDVIGAGVEDLPRLVSTAGELGFRGLNITHPYKQSVVPLLDSLSSDAARLGAVNTVLFRNGKSIGYNTDSSGFGASLARGLPDADLRSVVQIGAGGAGVAVAYALMAAGVGRLTIIDTESRRASQTADLMDEAFPGRTVTTSTVHHAHVAMSAATGMVNATPMGMTAHPGMPVSMDCLGPDLWVADVVYRPAETELVAAARSVGARVLPGTGMAVYQAVDAFEIFTGVPADAEAMTAHMQSMLEAE